MTTTDPSRAQEHAVVRAAVDNVPASFADGWKTNDGAALAGFFVEDGTLINPFGQRADGRGAIAAMYSEYFAGMLQGTSTTFKLESVRAVETEPCLRRRRTDHLSPPAAKSSWSSTSPRLLRRDGDGWRFVDSRPYTFAAPA